MFEQLRFLFGGGADLLLGRVYKSRILMPLLVMQMSRLGVLLRAHVHLAVAKQVPVRFYFALKRHGFGLGDEAAVFALGRELRELIL